MNTELLAMGMEANALWMEFEAMSLENRCSELDPSYPANGAECFRELADRFRTLAEKVKAGNRIYDGKDIPVEAWKWMGIVGNNCNTKTSGITVEANEHCDAETLDKVASERRGDCAEFEQEEES